MKPLIIAVLSVGFLSSGFAADTPNTTRRLGDLNVIPKRVLERTVSPRFFNSLVVSPVEGWIVVRANLSGTKFTGARVIHSELGGVYDPLALQLAKETTIAGNYAIERPHLTSSVVLHVLVYKIADGTMVLSFAHFDHPAGDQMEYWGSSRLLTLKANKWNEIMGPASLGKGFTVRQGTKNNLVENLRMDGRLAAESTNYNLRADGRARRY
ncbi:MAG TPA: hypothetical protein VLH83_01700 [Chthoniobacterales bacterium]|nr:hypothetical protein [Chthoniobacterales bacterium]